MLKKNLSLINYLVMKIHATNTANVVMGAWLNQVARQPQGTDLVHFQPLTISCLTEAKKTEILFTPYPYGDYQFLQLSCLLFSLFLQKNSQSPCSM